jgi:biotin carboxyl carrier protein
MGIISARVFGTPVFRRRKVKQKLVKNYLPVIRAVRDLALTQYFLSLPLNQISLIPFVFLMYNANINGRKIEVVPDASGLIADGDPLEWDIVKLSEGQYHILYKKKSYRAEVVKADRATKTFTLKINNRVFTTELKDKFDLLLEKMGMNASASAKINSIKAPMPGLIIDLRIQSGDSVMVGDQLLILEAMKMENIIKSPGEGVVKNVKVKKGDSVEKGQVLIEF